MPDVPSYEAFTPKMAEPISARTCNATFERLKFALNWLAKTGREVQTINWDAVRIDEESRITEFKAETEELLFETFRKDYLDALEFAVLARPRKGQVVDVKWSDIDWTYECSG